MPIVVVDSFVYNASMKLSRLGGPLSSLRFFRPNTRWALLIAPGLAVKRWILLLLTGVFVAGLGLAFVLRNLHIPPFVPPTLTGLTLPYLSDWLRGGLLLAGGTALVGYGVWQINRQVAAVLLGRHRSLNSQELVDVLMTGQERRRRLTGPKIVVIGGGTGMPTLLRGLRQYTENITAVVTVADDGGSSGILRQRMGVLPPGDFRNNIAALSDAEELMTQLLQYRFGDRDGLDNHNFGNLFITTMTALSGSFEAGIADSSRVLAVRGRILPSTLDNVVLCAEVRRHKRAQVNGTGNGNGHSPPKEWSHPEEWVYVRGESNIPSAGGEIVRVHLEPSECRAYPETVQAILQADLILAAPGSFFTSLMPNLLVPYVREAICASGAVRLYVCNVATEPGETDGFGVSDHLRHLRLHAGSAFTAVLANDAYPHQPPGESATEWVTLPEDDEVLDYRLFTGDIVDDKAPRHHHPAKMAAQVMKAYRLLLDEKNGRKSDSSESTSLAPRMIE
ncbi:MAG: uridine diphosphate-N-acetylglucosamine-binding protein YvcK [Caldilineaceae bacterium]|nr:uridine diphosphate-N-acetylglucosamine-binding protein YvcK [Caldilineaceae bacterium]